MQTVTRMLADFLEPGFSAQAVAKSCLQFVPGQYFMGAYTNIAFPGNAYPI